MKKLYKCLDRYNHKDMIEHLKTLNVNEQKCLSNELKSIDLKLMKKLFVNSYIDEELDINKISDLRIISKINKDEEKIYNNIGKKIIVNNNYGIVIMAGGNASRLGLDIPKGLVEINCDGIKKSLFEIYIDKLKNIYLKENIYINVYIMVNSENEIIIKKHFEEKNYFNYPKDKINFFIQKNLPLIGLDGKLLLKDKNHLWLVPNGNGNVFESLKINNLIKDMEDKNIKYLLFTGIDNPMLNLVDYNFLGCTIANNYKLSSKTIYKSNILDLDWIFCKYNGKPFMLDDRYIKYFNNLKNINGDYCYREKNIIYHLIHIDYVKKFSRVKLKYHRAYKEYSCLNKSGMKEQTKSFKFEQFIYDAFYYAKDMLLYRTNELEFCPIKRKEDILKVELLLNNKK